MEILNDDEWEVPEATTPRGWYWPKGSTKRGETTCAGFFLDYGVHYKRLDEKAEIEPGNVLCVVLSKDGKGQVAASKFFRRSDEGKAWIVEEWKRDGQNG